MDLRVAIRNWLLKPSKAELAELAVSIPALAESLVPVVCVCASPAEAQVNVVDFGEMTEAESAFVNGEPEP